MDRHIGTVTATVSFEIRETAGGDVELVWKVSDYARRHVDEGRTDDAGFAVDSVRASLAGRLDRLIEGVDDAEILRDELRSDPDAAVPGER